MNTHDYFHSHIFLFDVLCCSAVRIIHGANPRDAITDSFHARKIVNALFASGMTLEDIERMIERVQAKAV